MSACLRHSAAIVGYLLLSIAVTWPLTLHLTTHLTGSPSGDTGVYVWNTWVFRHEIVEHGRLPYVTDTLLGLTGGADLSLHNYTVFADLISFPVQPWLGVVGAFNLSYLVNVALAGYAAFLLIRRLAGRDAEAWLAGALFAASPVLVARGTAHFSLVAAAPLPLFTLFLIAYLDGGRARHAVAAGLTVAWAALCDSYYPVFCVLIGAVVAGARLLDVRLRHDGPVRSGAARTLEVAIALVAVLALDIALRGGRRIAIAGVRVDLITLYTPVLLLVTLTLVRLALTLRPRFALAPGAPWPRVLRLVAIAGGTGLVALLPLLVKLAWRIADGRFVSPAIYWRSSPPGADLLAFFMPNPNSPWFGAPFLAWLATARPDGFPEYCASLSLVALAVILAARATTGLRQPRVWVVLTAAFALLALGPFVRVGGVNTYIPGPWALLRYVPIVGLARAPSRFAIVSTLGVSILMAFALAALRDRHPRRRTALLAIVAAVLAVELVAAPRPLYSAQVSEIYGIIAADPDHARRVLELPVGLRDGTSSLGNYSARSQFRQTRHGKPLVGGYLSRISESRKQRYRRMPVLDVLIRLSAGEPVDDASIETARRRCPGFLKRANIGYVVIDGTRASPELRAFAVDLFGLVTIAADRDRNQELFRPTGCAGGPPAPRRRSAR